MKIDGRIIADKIYNNLRNRTIDLKLIGIVPHLAVILIGDDPASLAYISQKKKWSDYIGAHFSLIHYPATVTQQDLLKSVNHLNTDPKIHGIIIQRPLPSQIDRRKIANAVSIQKDIDGFRLDSPYTAPVAQAVVKVLAEIFYKTNHSSVSFMDWLRGKFIVVVGKGETAGGPISRYLQKTGLRLEIISSLTEHPETILKKADIIITAVGKPGIIRPEFIKHHAILLGVGLHKGEDEKLHGDYIAEDIKQQAAFYTPVIGGIGPVNVAYLLSSLVTAAESFKT